MKINGETKVIGFFGSTFKTSKMYAMYNAAFEVLNLNYTYIPFEVTDLKQAVDGIRTLGIKGVGVTVPYKIEILKYLDELDDNARRIGAVNVVINNNGKLIGGNTDGIGAVKALKKITTISGKKIILLGSGGAARAIAFALTDAKGMVVILNRTGKTAEELARSAGCRSNNMESLSDEMKDTDIIINATTVGMNPDNNKSLVPRQFLKPNMIVMDLVTNPENTMFLNSAQKAGCKIVFGKSLLFWQAVEKFKMFTGHDAPIKEMERTLYA